MKRTASALLIYAVAGTYGQDATWESVSIPGICTYQIPPTMEIQKGTYKRLNDEFRRSVLEITDSRDRVVAQPKGISDFDQTSLKRYCRVIVETERGSRGEYSNLDEPLALSDDQLREIDRALKDQIKQSAALLASKGMKMEILSWQPAKIVRLNGVEALMITYSRSISGAPPVLVSTYEIQNNDCLHTVTISYRESEKALWATDLGNVIETFRFKKRFWK